MALDLSTKRVQLDKTNSSIVIVVAIASVVVAFSLVSAKALLSQYSYQSKVIAEQEKALIIAEENIESSKKLVETYQTFNGQAGNIIGGASAGASERDGDNSKIILDALPGQYDFPAVISSVEKLLLRQGLVIDSIAGDDISDGVAITTTDGSEPVAANSDTPVEMPFSFKATGSYLALVAAVNEFERSIRPFAFTNMELSGGDAALSLTVDSNTFYQPSKELKFTEKVIK